MPISGFNITSEQRDEIERLLSEAEMATAPPSDTTPSPGSFQPLYDYIVQLTTPTEELRGQLSGAEFESLENVHRFLRGARQVNADIGFFSIWVRGYTQRQIDHRTTVPDGFSFWIQEASNQIVEAITQQIIDNFDDNPTDNHMPTTTEVAFADAESSVQNVLTQLNFRAGDSGLSVGAAWAGTPFFPKRSGAS